jgi:cytochrome P450
VEQRLTQLTMAVILQAVFSSRLEPAALEAAEQAVQTVSRIAQGEFFWPASWPDAMPWTARKRRAMAMLRGLVERHLQDRLAQPEDGWPDDLLSRLMALHRAEPGRWTLRAVADECTTAFLAGHETVAASLTWWCWCLADNPQEQDRLAQEVAQALAGADPGPQHLGALPRLRASLQESQRLYPAAPMLINRRATAPVTLGGRTLPARTLFMIPVQQLQRDARWYPQPDHFQPERFLQPDEQRPRGAWMPFGAGPRVCLGQHLAQDEMLVVAALLLQRWSLAPAPGEPAPVPEMAVTLRPRTPLRLTLLARR